MLGNFYVLLLVLGGFVLIVAGLLLPIPSPVKQPVAFSLVFLFVAAAVYALTRRKVAGNLRELIACNARAYHLSIITCLLVFPLAFTLLGNIYWIHVAVLVGIYVCLSLGLNMTVGSAGLLDLGYVAFYAIGAYLSAIFFRNHPDAPWMFWILLPSAGLLAGIFGLLLGSPTLRLRGDYLAIVTLGFGQIVRIILNNWESVTNGPKGIADIPSPVIGTYSFDAGIRLGSLALPRVASFYYLVLLLALGMGIAANRLNHSRIGRAWIAIREDELAAECAGINVMAYKLLAFGIGASFAGMAGVLYSSLMSFVDPMSFTFMESAMIVCMVVLGGMGSIPGVIVGAAVLVVLPEKLREFQQIRMLLFGVALIAMMIFRPEGLIPSRRRKLELLEKDHEPEHTAAASPALE